MDNLKESYPELGQVQSEIYEKLKDLGRTYNDVKVKVYREQFDRIRRSALSSETGESFLAAYRRKLAFLNNCPLNLNQEIIQRQILHLSDLLAKELKGNYAEDVDFDEKFATHLYFHQYTLRATYILYTRRIKLEYLKELQREMDEPSSNNQTEAGTAIPSVDELELPYPPVTSVQTDFFESTIVKKGSLNGVNTREVIDLPVELIMHIIYEQTLEWDPTEKTSVHKWKILYQVLLRQRYFRIVEKQRYTDFVKAVVKYCFPGVEETYSNNLSKNKLDEHYELWSQEDKKVFQSLKEALNCSK